MKYKLCLMLFSIAVLWQGCYYDNEEELYQHVQDEPCNVTTATYAADIAPILLAYCTRCHRNGREDGGVNLEGYDKVKPYVNDGSLFGTTNHDAGFSPMPPSTAKIPACDIEKMRLWIADGAPNN